MTQIPSVQRREVPTVSHLAAQLRRDPVRWAAAATAAAAVPPAADWQSILEALGHRVERRPDGTGLLLLRGGRVAVLRTADGPARLDRLDPDGRPLPGVLLGDCAREGARFGLLASGGRLRLYDAAAEVRQALA